MCAHVHAHEGGEGEGQKRKKKSKGYKPRKSINEPKKRWCLNRERNNELYKDDRDKEQLSNFDGSLALS